MAVSNSITRRSVIAGLALTAAPMTVSAGANKAYAQPVGRIGAEGVIRHLGDQDADHDPPNGLRFAALTRPTCWPNLIFQGATK
jgi:hypothetical protein